MTNSCSTSVVSFFVYYLHVHHISTINIIYSYLHVITLFVTDCIISLSNVWYQVKVWEVNFNVSGSLSRQIKIRIQFLPGNDSVLFQGIANEFDIRLKVHSSVVYLIG